MMPDDLASVDYLRMPETPARDDRPDRVKYGGDLFPILSAIIGLSRCEFPF